MSLTAGQLLGPYEVIEPIGAGGMGEVYRARDTTLGRDVAIKVLPEDFSADEERLVRFRREAQVLASLNHPNIAAIYGTEQNALVLELVEGPTLAERIAAGPIPLDEAIAIARQIAEALEAAHDAGVIHRDLKPANIKVQEDGTVKVLDFGLAKAVEGEAKGDSSESPTLTGAATRAGIILGTAAYMSPEQAKGKPVDKRADVWSFGAVLYEMLTGKRPFTGDDISETLAAVLRAEPDWDALPPEVSPTLRGYLTRCLEKNPKERVRDIGDVRLAMSGAFETTAALLPDARPSRSFTSGWLVAGAALLVGIVLGTGWWTATPNAPPRVARFVIESSAPPLTVREVALTRDGANIVYRWSAAGDESGRISVRAVDALEDARVQTDSPFPRFFLSPDGQWIGYFGQDVLQKVSIRGGPRVTICTLPPGDVRGASWGPDDTIIFGMSSDEGLWRVSAGGGEPERLLELENYQESHQWPDILPNGKAVLFTARAFTPGLDGDETDRVVLLSLDSGEVKVLASPGSHPRYVPTGHIVYGSSGTLRAVGFDIDRLEVTTDPVPVLDGVLWARSGHVAFDVAEDGSLAYITGPELSAAERRLLWVDREGREELLGAEARAYTYPRISPDGLRVAVDVRDEDNDIWIWEFARETLTRLTFDPNADFYPTWAPDGTRLAFSSNRAGSFNLFWKAADGTGAPEQLTENVSLEFPLTFSPDGTQLLFRASSGATIDLLVHSMESGGESAPLLATEFNELNAEISPDGRWLAFQSDDSGQYEIYARPFPNVDDGRWQISRGGGTQPLWRPDGRELFFFSASGHLMSAPIETDPFTPGNPARVLEGVYLWDAGALSQGRTYDISRDGKRFLMIREATDGPDTEPTQLILVQNWTEELKRLVPVDN